MVLRSIDRFTTLLQKQSIISAFLEKTLRSWCWIVKLIQPTLKGKANFKDFFSKVNISVDN